MRNFGDRDVDVPLAIFVILLFLSVVVFAPLVTLWSLNTLFGLGIEYGFYEWLAVVWLGLVTFGRVAYSVSKKD